MILGTTIARTGPLGRFFNSVPAQTLLALSFNIISLFAGGLISIFSPVFSESPWILALFPPILTIRGGIGGIFSGNLATMLHLGLVETRFRGNTNEYYDLVKSVIVITVFDSLIMGIASFLLNLLLGEARIVHLPIFIFVPCITCVMAVGVSVPLTSYIASETFKRGLDPDILVYPILASLNDIVVTTFFIVTSFLVLRGGSIWIILTSLFISALAASCLITWRNKDQKQFHQTIKEGALMVILSSIFGSINGLFLSNFRTTLNQNPGLVILYPALTNALGNIGSIIGSQTTTAMALGLSREFLDELKKSAGSILKIEASASFMYIIFAIISYLIARYQGANFLFLLSVALISNFSSFLIISLFALMVAYRAFQRGLNPDNVVIPAITSISDTIATISVIPASSIALLLAF